MTAVRIAVEERKTAIERKRVIEQTLIEERKRTAVHWIGPVGSTDWTATYELRLRATVWPEP